MRTIWSCFTRPSSNSSAESSSFWKKTFSAYFKARLYCIETIGRAIFDFKSLPWNTEPRPPIITYIFSRPIECAARQPYIFALAKFVRILSGFSSTSSCLRARNVSISSLGLNPFRDTGYVRYRTSSFRKYSVHSGVSSFPNTTTSCPRPRNSLSISSRNHGIVNVAAVINAIFIAPHPPSRHQHPASAPTTRQANNAGS